MAGFLHRCASYVMRGRQQAIIIGLLFTVLPLLGWVSNVIIALVTLRKGAKEGFIVFLWLILPVVVIAALGSPWIALYNIIGGSLFSFLLALVLRQTQSWQKVIEAGMLLGLLTVLVVHLLVPDISAVWVKEIGHYTALLKDQMKFALTTQQLQLFAKVATGFQFAFLWFAALINLMLARGLQSMLYNPGRLSPELESVRLSKWDGLLLVLIVVASVQKIAVAQDFLPVILFTFLLAGLSLLHAVVRIRNSFFKGWFFVFYLLLVFLFPYIAALLVLAALADSYLDFRHRVLPKR